MLVIVDELLDTNQVRALQQGLAGATWQDGQATAGSLARTVKHNQQLAPASELGVALGREVLQSLGRHPRFLSAALPEKILPPRFNRYSGGGQYGTHVDAAIMRIESSGVTLRSDLSATLFLSAPDEYDGGELLIETSFGAQPVKLDAGSLVLYPASSLHRVTPVTRGTRLAAFFWIQSLIRDDGERALLFDLDQTIQQLGSRLASDDPQLLALTGHYHNLLRRWASP